MNNYADPSLSLASLKANLEYFKNLANSSSNEMTKNLETRYEIEEAIELKLQTKHLKEITKNE